MPDRIMYANEALLSEIVHKDTAVTQYAKTL
jgi:hypothetical protein